MESEGVLNPDKPIRDRIDKNVGTISRERRSPRMQLTTVGREVWRGARKAQALQDVKAGDPKVQAGLRKLKQVEAFRKQKVDGPEIQALVGISRATDYRWRRRLKAQGLKGLLPKSKRPKRPRRKGHWTPEFPILVEALRKSKTPPEAVGRSGWP